MQGAVDGLGQLLIGGDGQEGVGRLHRNLELVEVVVLEDAGVVQRAFDHGVGAGLAVFFQQFLLQRARVDADPHGAAVVAGGLDDVAHSVGTADIAGIDPQAGGAGLGRLDAALVVEMDVGDQGDLGLARDGPEGLGGFHIGAGDAHDVGPGLFKLTDLIDRRAGVRGRRIGHGLDADGRVAADQHRADADLAALATLDMAPGTDVRMVAHRVLI